MSQRDQRDVGGEFVIALVALAVLVFAVIFGILLTLWSQSSADDAALTPTTEVAQVYETISVTQPTTPAPTEASPIVVVTEESAITTEVTAQITAEAAVDATTEPATETVTLEVFTLPYTPTPTPTFTATQAASATPTLTNTVPPTDTSTPRLSFTPTPTFTLTATATATATASPTNALCNPPTVTFSATPRPSPTIRPSATITPSPTFTPSSTATSTSTARPTSSPTATMTLTARPSSTPTSSPSWTPTARPSSTPTPTFSLTPSITPSPTATVMLMPTDTSTATPTDTLRPTVTSTSTRTATATPTPSLTLTVTVTLEPTASATMPPLPTLETPTPCTPPTDWILYTARFGETFELLSTAVDTPLETLLAANCRINDVENASLLAGDAVYLPMLPRAERPPEREALIGCVDPETAYFEDLEPGAVLQGEVTLTGSANAVNFWYAKIELRPVEDHAYRFVTRIQRSVMQNALATITTEDFVPGDYWLRLVVYNLRSQIPLTGVCVVPVTIRAEDDNS